MSKISSERKCEILGVLIIGLTMILALALVTDQFSMSGASTRVLDGSTKNLLGTPGSMLAGWLAFGVGDASHVVYALTLIWGLMLLWHRPVDRLLTRFTGAVILLGAVAGLLQVDLARGISNSEQPGGVFGAFVADQFLQPNFGYLGANVISVTLAIIGLLLATDFLFIHILVALQHVAVHLVRGGLALYEAGRTLWVGYRSGADARAEARAKGAAEREQDRAARESDRKTKESMAEKRAREKLARADEKKAAAEAKRMERAAAKSARKAETGARKAPMPEPPEISDTMADDLERIRVRTMATDDESPFDAVPELEPGEAAPIKPSAVTLDLEPEEPLEEEFSDEDVEADADESSEDEEPEIAESDSIPGEPAQMELIAPEGTARRPKSKKRMVRARRVTQEIDELPPDYEYPKRYTKPPVEIFDRPEARIHTNLDEELRTTSVLLEETLQTFGIEARVTDVTRGPTITRFELEPAPGIKVSRFLSLSDDIALALKAHRVRVEAPIPGKSRVGIEVPNIDRDQVLIRELLERRGFTKGKGKLNLAMGKDIAGEVVIADLATMPHLLVAGATGAGKTVCIKALMASLLCAHVPDELQLMLIDPKMVELSIFNDIPHLITPVVIDPKKASTALTWLINEMEERYRLFADLRVRNIEVYNSSVENGEIEVEGAEETDESQAYSVIRKLPYIVCIIDELADLMMLARAEVEDAIGRLAQLARAVGIHLIIATQRPSVDVLTGVIKANFPARVSFQVSSRVDSRCILDEIGAERLIGMGDMLYLPAGQSKPTRIQGAFVSDREMNGLIAHLKRQAPPQYRDEIENFGQSKDNMDNLLDESDPLFEEAVQVVLDTGQASISMVQRRLRVGYTRAARLIDMMELRGIVGPHTGSKAREILVSTPPEDEVA